MAKKQDVHRVPVWAVDVLPSGFLQDRELCKILTDFDDVVELAQD